MSGIKGRPRGRPFAKGQSGNPGGRPIKPRTIEQRKLETDVRMFARDWGFEAIDKLAALMRGVVRVEIDGKPVEMLVPPMTQLAAANAILDRGYGRPPPADGFHDRVGQVHRRAILAVARTGRRKHLVSYVAHRL